MISLKKVMAVIMLGLLLAVSIVGNTFAAPKNDTDNHIDCDNSDYVIPTTGAIRLDETTGWHKVKGNMLTNFFSMYQPEVIYVPEWDVEGGYPYMMWFFAWAYNQENDPQPSTGYEGLKVEGPNGEQLGGDMVFCARAKSVEGPWEVYSNKGNKKGQDDEFYWDKDMNPFYWYPVIMPSNTWFNSWHIGDPSVVYKDGTLYMALSSMGADEDLIPTHKAGDVDGNSSCIVGATSTDGINWNVSDKPLIVWENEKGFDEDAKGDKYYGGHQRPSIMFEDGKWKMWYDFRGNQVGYAECNGDFINGTWTEHKTGATGLLTGVDFDVIKIGSIYYAYGDPYMSWVGVKDRDIPYYSSDSSQWSQRQIVEYQSYDGLKWVPTGYFLPDADYDANQIPQTFIDHKTGRIYIFYATQRGVKKGQWGGKYDWRWANIRCMYRDVELFAIDANTMVTPAPSVTPTPTPTITPTVEPTVTEPAITDAPTATVEPVKTNNGQYYVLAVSVICSAFILGLAFYVRKRNSKQ